jgi:hypothetical protein
MGSFMHFIDKLKMVEKVIAEEKGDFILFAIVQREDGIGLWDLLLSASWFGVKETETLDFIVGKIKEVLTSDEMMLLSRIVLFPQNDPRVQQILQLVPRPIYHENVSLSSLTLSSMPVSHAHIITATTPQTAASTVSISFPKPSSATGETGVTQVSE